MKSNLVHCYKCGAILFKLNEEEEFDLQVKCIKCGIDQRVVVEVIYKIAVIPGQKENKDLSTF